MFVVIYPVRGKWAGWTGDRQTKETEPVLQW